MIRRLFKSRDGLQLTGILMPPLAKSNTCIILCHGFSADKDETGNFVELSSRIVNQGYAVFRFDFRAHGESEGSKEELTISGEELDLQAAYEFLIKEGYSNFGIVAASFSAGPASLFLSKRPDDISALVLLYSRLDFKGYINKTLNNAAVAEQLERQGSISYKDFRISKKLVSEMQEIQPVEKLKSLKMPILFIHGDNDTTVPYAESAEYAKALNSKLITVHGAGHGLHGEQYLKEAIDAISNFFGENLEL